MNQRTKRITVFLSEKELKKLINYADKAGVNMQDYIRMLIQKTK